MDVMDFGRVVLHELRVFVDEGLALRPVGDHEFDLRLRLDVRREPRASGAHHAELAQPLAEHKSQDSKTRELATDEHR
jgi:hypothetical protein